MKDILADLDRWERDNEEIAVATVVGMRGSAPRLAGARFGVTRSGRLSGSVSAGCVEGDVIERAMRVLDGGAPELPSYGITDEMGMKVGMSCGGAIDVLIERHDPGQAWRAARDAVRQERPASLAVVLQPESLRGRKVAVLADGRTEGSIEPSLDAALVPIVAGLLAEAATRVVTVPWSGGEASVFVESFAPPLRMFIVGATHTGIALCRLAKVLGYRVTVVDARGPFATRERFPEADEVLREWPHEVLEREGLSAYSEVIVLTHDPKFDIPTLACALRSPARYVGALGSRVTQQKRIAELRAQGFSEADLDRIRAPIGLDIGARTPEEIALAILAEILAVRYGRDGRALKEKRARIHDV